MFADLLGRTSAMQMLVCAITGKLLDEDDMLVFDDILTAMSSADPRLWPFKITRLASSYGNAAFGMGATFAASQGAIFGSNRFQEIAEVLEDLRRRVSTGDVANDELLSVLEQGAAGFGILYGKHDARFDALVGAITRHGRHRRPYMKAALQAVHVARTKLSVEPHVFVAIAALCLDMNMSTYEVGMVGMLPLFHDALANAAEGAMQRPKVLQALEPDTVKYAGMPHRVSKRAALHATQDVSR